MEIFTRKNPFTGPLKGVILGWAGVAVDCGGFGAIQAFIDVFRQNWVEIGPEDIRKHAGLSYRDHLVAMLESETVSALWLEAYGAPPSERDLERLYRSVESLMPAYVANHAEPVPGLLEAVGEFRARGLSIGSTTSHGYPALEALSEAARQTGYEPDVYICSSDVPAGRPYPWMCYQNAINLEIYPLQALVKIGDTVPSIQEGLNAGMWTIGVVKTSSDLGMSEEELARADWLELAVKTDALKRRLLDAGAHFAVDSIADCPEAIERINEALLQGERCKCA